MNRKELTAAIAADAGCDQTLVRQMLAALERRTMQAVKKGEQVALTGFGTFDRVQRARRTARNPRTGEPVKVPARKAPVFRAGATFRDVVAGKALPAMPGGRSTSTRAARTTGSASSRSSGSRAASASRSGGTQSKPGGRPGSVRAGSAGSMRRGSRTRS